MHTPNELRDLKFDKAVFGGYDVASVDEVFKSLTEDYTTLFKENAILKKKLKLLAETVEDYRGVDEAMRKALITAQNMANDMVADAEKKSRDMLDTATNEAKAKIGELTRLVAEEEAKLAAAKAETAKFIEEITQMFNSQSEKLARTGMEIAPPAEQKAVETPAVAEDTLDEISKSLEEKMRQEDEKLAAEAEQLTMATVEEESSENTIVNAPEIPTDEEMTALEEAAEKKPKKSSFEFVELKFGKDYDITDEK